MRLGTIAVREAIGPDVPGITDGEIQEALWHYYYDVGKSVTYLLNSRTEKPKKAKKANGGSLFFRANGCETNERACAKAVTCDVWQIGGRSMPHISSAGLQKLTETRLLCKIRF